MGFSDVWNRTLVYFGIAEDEEWDEDGLATEEELERLAATVELVAAHTPETIPARRTLAVLGADGRPLDDGSGAA